MASLPTITVLNNKQSRNQKFQDLQDAAKDWLDYNRKILNAQADFLTEIKKRRGDNNLDDASENIKPLLINNLREFLSHY